VGTFIAVYVLATGVRRLQFVTGVQWLNDMFNGVALVTAVAFAAWRQRSKAAGPRRGRADSGGGPDAVPPPGDGDAVRRTGEAATAR